MKDRWSWRWRARWAHSSALLCIQTGTAGFGRRSAPCLLVRWRSRRHGQFGAVLQTSHYSSHFGENPDLLQAIHGSETSGQAPPRKSQLPSTAIKEGGIFKPGTSAIHKFTFVTPQLMLNDLDSEVQMLLH